MTFTSPAFVADSAVSAAFDVAPRAAGATLPRDHALAVLAALAHDDDFRARFAARPADALVRLGVPADLVAALAPQHLVPAPLADKAAFEASYRALASDLVEKRLSMIVPMLRLAFGKPVH